MVLPGLDQRPSSHPSQGLDKGDQLMITASIIRRVHVVGWAGLDSKGCTGKQARLTVQAEPLFFPTGQLSAANPYP